MIHGALGHLDVAQIVVYAFFLFFAGLVWYLRQEDRREGYPLESEAMGRLKDRGFLFIPPVKTYRLGGGKTLQTTTGLADTRPIKAAKVEPWPGAPIEPIGDPLTAGVGPGAWAERPDETDKTFDGHDLIAPLRVATNYAVTEDVGNPLGFTVLGADGKRAGSLRDLWVDRAESVVRFYEISLDAGGYVLAPVHFADVSYSARSVKINALLAAQIARAPQTRNPDAVTMLEEEKISAFFGAGTLYATAERQEPLL